MATGRWGDFERLIETATGQFHGDADSVHGPTHWRRVEQNGIWLSSQTGADQLVVRLFAWFHDCRRVNDFTEKTNQVFRRAAIGTMHHIQGYPITIPLPATRHLDSHMPGGFRDNPGGSGSALPFYPALPPLLLAPGN